MRLMNNKSSLPNHLFLFGLFVLAVSIAYSKFLVSISEILIAIGWLSSGNVLEKIKLFFKNKTAVLLSSIFALHCIGLLYTSDFNYGIEDIRKKIPLLLFPLFFSTTPPLTKKTFNNLLIAFVSSIVIATVLCFFALLGYFKKEILQPQDASIFISHIRFGLMISLSISILGFFFKNIKSLFLKFLIPIIIAWLIIFLIIMESATGIVCTFSIALVFTLQQIITTPNKTHRYLLIFFLLAATIVGANVFNSIAKNIFEPISVDKNNLVLETAKHNPYTHNQISNETENGNFIWLYVCEKELSEEWNKRSSIKYSGKDLRGNELKYTLIRFLTSKDLKKDAKGVNLLSNEEIRAIERGTPNFEYMGIFNPAARIKIIVWEFNTYLKGGNPSGHSVVQRLEYWKAALNIIKENVLCGVGTGDVETAFSKEYEKVKSPLSKEWRLRSHNQFLAIGTALGIMGILLFFASLFYPLLKHKTNTDILYLTFFIIVFLSFLSEDTLESQTGATFYAFFNSLFLFFKKPKESV